MKINFNVSAAIANKHLLGIENNLSASMERLSSGLKINNAKDNPAGMAISNKMRAQIDGLNRASQNASDGISVIQIADGALNETTNILQRMRELSVQAANDGTLAPEDKKAIQAEIDSLKDEVNRISTDTEYNSKTLLNGSLDTRVYTKYATRVDISDHVSAGKYNLTVTEGATQAIVESKQDFTSKNQIGVSGVMTINGSVVDISQEDTYEQVYAKIRDAAEVGEAAAELDESGFLNLSTDAYGTSGVLKITFDKEELANEMGFYSVEKEPDSDVFVYKDNGTIPRGTDAEIEMLKDGTGFGNTATYTADGNRVTITDRAGFTMSFLIDEGYGEGKPILGADGKPIDFFDGEIEFDVTDIGTMMLHIGANEDQEMEVRIQEISCKSLYIDDLDVTTVTGADRAMTRLSDAISKTSSVRSKLGAYQNRLESTVASLDSFEEDMTGAMSRLTDADMAAEMTDYTHQNVLNQAAISVLTQANDLPQQVLQILQ